MMNKCLAQPCTECTLSKWQLQPYRYSHRLPVIIVTHRVIMPNVIVSLLCVILSLKSMKLVYYSILQVGKLRQRMVK